MKEEVNDSGYYTYEAGYKFNHRYIVVINDINEINNFGTANITTIVVI